MASIKLGELLVKAHVIQESQLNAALAEQKKWGGRLGEILVRMSLVTEDLITRALSRQLSLQAVNVDAVQGVPPAVKAKISAKLAKELEVVPLQLKDEGKTLVVAMSDPTNLSQVDTLRAHSRCRIVPQLAGRSAIARAYSRFYEGEDISDVESSFKVVDAQGRTVIKQAPQPPKENPASAVDAAFRKGASLSDVPALRGVSRPGEDPLALLERVEQMQRQEVSALKAMVELLIQRGVFTRDEYLAKVKR